MLIATPRDSRVYVGLRDDVRGGVD